MPPGMVKRYPFSGPLLGYIICCPGCQNCGTHVLDKTENFIEDDGKLYGCLELLTCMICDRNLQIAAGVIYAELPKAETPCSSSPGS